MTCEGCAEKLRRTLVKVLNVKPVEVDCSSKMAIVRLDPGSPVSTEQVIAAAEGAGYTASFVGKQGR